MTDQPAPTPTPTPPAPAPAPAPTPTPTPTPDISGLQTALNAERVQREAAERAARSFQDKIKELEKGQMTEADRKIAEAIESTKKEATSGFNKRLFGAEVRAHVAGKVVDPTLFADLVIVMSLLGMTEIPMKGEDLDTEAIKKAVDTFLSTKPYLTNLGSVGQNQRFPPVDQGAKTDQQPDFSKMSDEAYMKWADEHDPHTRRRRGTLRMGA